MLQAVLRCTKPMTASVQEPENMQNILNTFGRLLINPHGHSQTALMWCACDTA